MKLLRSPFPVVAGAAWLVAAALIAFFAPGEARPSLFVGWALAGVTGLMSFGLLAYANGRELKVFLSGVLGGFLVRLVIVALGFFWALRRGYDPLWICVSFFALYWVFFICEYLAVRGMVRPGSTLATPGAVS